LHEAFGKGGPRQALDKALGRGFTHSDTTLVLSKAHESAERSFSLGVDISAGMIARAQLLTDAEGLRNVQFEQADAPIWAAQAWSLMGFKVLCHGLCWIHAERLIHTLLPLNEDHREDIAMVRGHLWQLYADLKLYKRRPRCKAKRALERRFDDLFSQKTRYQVLNELLKRLRQNKPELLLVLDRPDIPLHTNDSERDLRDYLKKRKVSGSTRSELARRCRDTFISLKKTCRKQGISFWAYLMDRLSQTGRIPSLSATLLTTAARG